MTCPTCKEQKTKDDFYWREDKRYKAGEDCKECLSKKRKEARRKDKDFLYQYFN